MSYFGVASVCFLLVILILVIKERYPKKSMVSLAILITLQIYFVFQDACAVFRYGSLNSLLAVIFFPVVAFIMSVIVDWLLELKRYKANNIFVIVALLLLVYTEYFNGVYTFNSVSEFQQFNMPIKKYYYLIPHKLTKDKEIKYQDQASVFYFDFLYPTIIKRDKEGRIFYYQSSGFGESGYWFEYGIPEGQQVANYPGNSTMSALNPWLQRIHLP